MERGKFRSSGGVTGAIGQPEPYIAIPQSGDACKSFPPPEINLFSVPERMIFIYLISNGADAPAD